MAGLAVGSVTRQAIWLLALVGLPVLAIGWREQWRQARWRQWIILWGLLMVPVLLAMPDAVDPMRSGRTALRLLSYALMAAVLFRWAPAAKDYPRFIGVSGAILVLLLIDGVVQYFSGTNIVGEPLYQDLRYGDRVTGLLGLDFGWVFAVLSPMVLEAARVGSRRGYAFWLVVPLLLVAVLLSGSRASLLVMLMGWLVYAALITRSHGRAALLAFLGPVAAGVVAVLVLLLLSAETGQRWRDALGVLASDSASWNEALSLRPELWSAAITIFQDHWLNGVGVRGYGVEAEPLLASVVGLPDKPQGWSPHLAVFEVMTDLGLLGLLGYGVFYVVLLRGLWGAPALAVGPGLAAVLAFFPFGATLPLFSMRVAGIGWLCLTMAMVMVRDHEQNAGVPG